MAPARRSALKLTKLLAGVAGVFALPFNPLLKRLYPAPEVSVVSFKTPGAHQALRGLRIVYVSDLHAGPLMRWRYLRDMVARINALAPDVILLGGDYVLDDPGPLKPLAAVLGDLKAPMGVIAVRGNHDLTSGNQLHRAFADAGIELLVNQGRRLDFGGSGFWLGGVDYFNYRMAELDKALDGRRDGEFTLLLSHNPDFIVQIPAGTVDLMLSGHTHGGQIKLFGHAIVSNSRHGMKYLEGWTMDGPCPLYVSRGIGTIRVALRIGSRPEIVVVEFV